MARQNRTESFSLRLTETELNRLVVIASSTERSAAGVIRGLIAISDMPEVRRLLGEPLHGAEQSIVEINRQLA